MHPLSIEDILQQETREKVETFDRLGYQFVAFRALDESYFRYSEVSSSPALSPQSSDASSHTVDEKGGSDGSVHDEKPVPSQKGAGRGKLDIVEGVGGKEGVEGVGVGAINLYFCIYEDGILSVSSYTRMPSLR